MKFSIHTLGCKVNQYESEVIAGAFEAKGFIRVKPEEACDVCCINTCAVTEESVRKSMQMIRRAKRLNPDAVIAVTGCVSQSADYVDKIAEIADITTGNSEKAKLPELVLRFIENKQNITEFKDISREKSFEPMTAYTGERTRAALKIQDGCDNFCSYCIIPFVRGRIRSKPFAETVGEIKELAGKYGYKEIVLTGIHLDNYGKDLGNTDIIAVLEAAEKTEALQRIRLSSLEPVFITKENVSRMKRLTKLCHHFHLSLQSGCDATLKRMNRHYTTTYYANAVDMLREAFPDTAVTTDIIVGFPGETEAEFEETLLFAKSTGFAKIHVFPFSERKGTAAALMPDKITAEIKNERCRILNETAAESRRAFLHTFIGKTVPVLFESERNGLMCGYTPNYAEVRVKAEASLCNIVRNVLITQASGEYVTGELYSDG